MDKETRFCPFKKEITRTMRRGKSGELEMEYYEKFKRCTGARCMAYDEGGCLKLTPREPRSLHKGGE
ncbi:hypothetical protein [Eisenbergiella sp.]